MAKYNFTDQQAHFLQLYVEGETKRVRNLEVDEATEDGLKMSEKVAWLAELQEIRTELVRYKNYLEVKHV